MSKRKAEDEFTAMIEDDAAASVACPVEWHIGDADGNQIGEVAFPDAKAAERYARANLKREIGLTGVSVFPTRGGDPVDAARCDVKPGAVYVFPEAT